jgi:hypothetical protein
MHNIIGFKIENDSTITFSPFISEGEDCIFFIKPLLVEYFVDVEDGKKNATVTFDFGMEQTIPLDSDRNMILKDNEDKSDGEKVAIDISFDLFHAFFHCSEDPNYSHYHWALYGNLKDRLKCYELPF